MAEPKMCGSSIDEAEFSLVFFLGVVCAGFLFEFIFLVPIADSIVLYCTTMHVQNFP